MTLMEKLKQQLRHKKALCSPMARCGDVLQDAFTDLLQNLEGIQIGAAGQFPFGWRRANKGRTVCRIVEEFINQNIEFRQSDYALKVQGSDSETTVYDAQITMETSDVPVFVNHKASTYGRTNSKDDISKATWLITHFQQYPDCFLYVATFYCEFRADMKIKVMSCSVVPLAWIPDVYVNPRNHNLQTAHYQSLENCIPRTNQEFVEELERAIKLAGVKQARKKFELMEDVQMNEILDKVICSLK